MISTAVVLKASSSSVNLVERFFDIPYLTNIPLHSFFSFGGEVFYG